MDHSSKIIAGGARGHAARIRNPCRSYWTVALNYAQYTASSGSPRLHVLSPHPPSEAGRPYAPTSQFNLYGGNRLLNDSSMSLPCPSAPNTVHPSFCPCKKGRNDLSLPTRPPLLVLVLALRALRGILSARGPLWNFRKLISLGQSWPDAYRHPSS